MYMAIKYTSIFYCGSCEESKNTSEVRVQNANDAISSGVILLIKIQTIGQFFTKDTCDSETPSPFARWFMAFNWSKFTLCTLELSLQTLLIPPIYWWGVDTVKIKSVEIKLSFKNRSKYCLIINI